MKTAFFHQIFEIVFQKLFSFLTSETLKNLCFSLVDLSLKNNAYGISVCVCLRVLWKKDYTLLLLLVQAFD